MNKSATHTTEQQVKLYLIEKTLQHFGADSVSCVKDKNDCIQLYFYPANWERRAEVLQDVRKAFDASILNNGKPQNGVAITVKYCKINSIEADEQLYCLEVYGALRDMRNNMRKNDKTTFDAAMKSHTAQEILRRDESRQLSIS